MVNHLFFSMAQIYSNKTATILKANATVPYPIYLVLLNFQPKFLRFLSDIAQMLVGLPFVSATERTHVTSSLNHNLKKYVVCSNTIIPIRDELYVIG